VEVKVGHLAAWCSIYLVNIIFFLFLFVFIFLLNFFHIIFFLLSNLYFCFIFLPLSPSVRLQTVFSCLSHHCCRHIWREPHGVPRCRRTCGSTSEHRTQGQRVSNILFRCVTHQTRFHYDNLLWLIHSAFICCLDYCY